MPDLEIRGVTTFRDRPDRFHVWGEVENRGETTYRWVKVVCGLLDAQGHMLAQESDLVGLEWIASGRRVPFHLVFTELPEHWHRHELEVTGRPHDFRDDNVPQPHFDLDVSKTHYREIGWGDLLCSIIGLLSNSSGEPATHVKVAGTLYGPSGTVVGVLSPYLVPRGAFHDGADMVFELKYYHLADIVVNFMVQVQGRRVMDE